VDHSEEWEAVFYPLESRFDPAAAINVDYDNRDLSTQDPDQAVYMLPQADLGSAAYLKEARSTLRDHLSRNLSRSIFRNSRLRLCSRIGESRADFEARCLKAAEDNADLEVAKLKDKYDAFIDRVKSQLSDADRRVRELDADTRQRKQQEQILGASDLLRGLLGGRRGSVSLSRAAYRHFQTKRLEERLRTAEEKMTDKATELDRLEDKLAEEIAEICERMKSAALQIEAVVISLDKGEVDVDDLSVLWIPVA
jgi:hypothetical protein